MAGRAFVVAKEVFIVQGVGVDLIKCAAAGKCWCKYNVM